MQRVLVFGQMDLNLIDGSAIWLASVAEVLAALPEVHVTLLLVKSIERDLLVRSLVGHPRLELLDLWQLAKSDAGAADLLRGHPGRRLEPATAAAAIDYLFWQRRFDLCLVRGTETAAQVARRPHLAERLWIYVPDPNTFEVNGLPGGKPWLWLHCRRMLCQTEEARAALSRQLGVDPARLTVLSPMIPALGTGDPAPLNPAAPRLGYAGKLSPPYRILEMLDAFEIIRQQRPGAEFHVVGDKIHNAPPRPNFEADVRRRLQATPGVIWHGGVSREESQAILSRVHVASSWRDASFDDSLELSTKVLEYSALGIPTLLNPTPLQMRLFGPAYAGYVETADEFVERFLALSASAERYRALAAEVRQVAERFTYAAVGAHLRPRLAADRAVARPRPARRLLFAGHDLRFARFLIEHFEQQPGYVTAIDSQRGHMPTNLALTQARQAPADLIFCEWALGNAVWHSQHKQPHQKLVVRLHRQELTTPFLDQIEWPQVDALIIISEHIQREFLERYPALADRTVMFHNAVDSAALARDKLEGAEFNLGQLGALPRLKAPDRALHIFEKLKQRDPRYRLNIKSRRPEELPWLLRRPEEVRYYRDFFAAVERSPFANAVAWEPYANDVADWFARVGFVLSTSEFEGSHQAVAEGMAAGTIPVIFNWTGADRLYPHRYIVGSEDEAVEKIEQWRTPAVYARESDFCRNYARRHFDQAGILRYYHQLFEQLLAGAPAVEAARAAGAVHG